MEPHYSLSPRRGRAMAGAALLAIGAGTILTSQVAFPHNAVLDTIPVAGSTVSESPIEVHVLTSDELLDLAGTGAGFAIVVQDDAGLYYGDGCVTITANDMFTTVDLGGAGPYEVTYQFVSADGHSLADAFGFTFAPPDSHSPAEGLIEPPRCGVEEVVGGIADETTVGGETDQPDGVVAEPLDADSELPGPSRDLITVAIAGVLIVLSITLLVWMIIRRNRG